jgi:BTB/POZ domain
VRLNHNPVCLYASWAAPERRNIGLAHNFQLRRKTIPTTTCEVVAQTITKQQKDHTITIKTANTTFLHHTMETISWEFPDLASDMNSIHKTTAKQALGTGWILELRPTSSSSEKEDDHDGDTTTNNEPTNQSEKDKPTKEKKKPKKFTLTLEREHLTDDEPVTFRFRFAAFSATTTNANHSTPSSLIWCDQRLGTDLEHYDKIYNEDLVLFDDVDDDDAAAINSMNNDKYPPDHTDHAGRVTLIITVQFKLLAAGDSTTTTEPVWKRNKILPHPTLTKMRTDSTWTDIAFAVAGRNFKAHRCILALHAPALLRLAENNKVKEEDSCDTTTTTTMIALPDVDPLAFAYLLAYCYDGSLPRPVRTFDAVKSLLIAADRFECTSVKLYVEHYAVENVLHWADAADFLLLADSISCAYLKEAALDEIAFVPEAVFQSDGWTRVMQSERLVMEVMRASYCEPTVEDKKRRAECMSVDTLRCHLAAKDLDVDGSRETLVKRFKAASNV